MKKKKKIFSFEDTIKTKDVWIWSIGYHLLVLLLNKVLPRKVIQSAKNIAFPPDVKPLVSTKSIDKNIVFFIDLVIFEVIFVVLFALYHRSNRKHYNLLAVFLIGLITITIYQLYMRVLLVNILR